MNILITGGAGFLASHLRNYLSVNNTVYAPTRQELDCLDSVSVNSFFERHSIDVVIHTALTGREQLFEIDPKWLTDSLLMWRNIFNNRDRFKQMIQFGSAYELDLNINNVETTLDNVKTALPVTSYGYAKNIIARICNDNDNCYTLRLFGNFHHTEKDFRFFKKLSLSAHFVINEDRMFDYFNLDDILKVVEFVIDTKPDTRDFNLVYKEKYMLSEQVKMFCDINKMNTNIEIKSYGNHLTGSSAVLDSFELKLLGLTKGFKKYT